MLNMPVLLDLNTLEYVQIYQWCYEMCWIDLECFNVSCGWDLNYAKKNDEIACWLV
jgi:hypothetical protein